MAPDNRNDYKAPEYLASGALGALNFGFLGARFRYFTSERLYDRSMLQQNQGVIVLKERHLPYRGPVIGPYSPLD